MLDFFKEIETAAEARKILDIADEISTTNPRGVLHIGNLSFEVHKASSILIPLLLLNCWREVPAHHGFYYIPE